MSISKENAEKLVTAVVDRLSKRMSGHFNRDEVKIRKFLKNYFSCTTVMVKRITLDDIYLYENYPKRSFAVVGNIQRYQDLLEELGGRANDKLTIAGETVPGYIFSNKKLKAFNKRLRLKKKTAGKIEYIPLGGEAQAHPKRITVEPTNILPIQNKLVDVLQQDVSKKTREVAVDKISKIYAKAMGVDKIPMGSAVVTILEDNMYNEFKKDPREYLRQIAKLNIFMDPKHYVGQFAETLREKMLQSIYTPERFFNLDVSELLPEVFLTPKANDAEKLDIYRQINELIINNIDDLVREFNFILDPTANRPTRPKPALPVNIDRKIKGVQVDIKDLCENPYWKMKKVNMIICKEKGKFYCLDIEQLLQELATDNTATNYFTQTTLSQEIIDNLKNRYPKEIQEIKQTGVVPSIGRRTAKEMIDISETLIQLELFKKVFNKKEMLESISLFSLVQMEDTSVGGKAGLLGAIPPSILENFENYLDTMSIQDFSLRVNKWLDNSIDEIKDILNVPDTDADDDHAETEKRITVEIINDLFEKGSLAEMDKFASVLGLNSKKALMIEPAKRGFAILFLLELLFNKGLINIAQRERIMNLATEGDTAVMSAVDVYTVDKDLEDLAGTLKSIIKLRAGNVQPDLVKKALAEGTIAREIYDRHGERMNDIKATLMRQLKKEKNNELRQNINEQLRDVNRLYQEYKNIKSIEDVIAMLQEQIEVHQADLEKLTTELGIGKIYSDDVPTAIEDVNYHEDVIKDFQADIERIRRL